MQEAETSRRGKLPAGSTRLPADGRCLATPMRSMVRVKGQPSFQRLGMPEVRGCISLRSWLQPSETTGTLPTNCCSRCSETANSFAYDVACMGYPIRSVRKKEVRVRLLETKVNLSILSILPILLACTFRD